MYHVLAKVLIKHCIKLAFEVFDLQYGLGRHTVFTVLMAFVIGWSSAVFAMQKPMQYQMQMAMLQTFQPEDNASDHAKLLHQNLHEVVETSYVQSDLNHCDEQAISHPTTSMVSTHDVGHCKTLLSQSDVHSHCDSCASWLCQTAIFGLNILDMQWALPQPNAYLTPSMTPFSAQDLPGYWQEILRPPQA